MNPIVIDLTLRILDSVIDHQWGKAALSHEVSKLQHLVEAAIRLRNPDERRQQVSPLLLPLQSLLHQISGNQEQMKKLHLALAAAYGVIGVEESQYFHLNRACDCVVRLMGSTSSQHSERKAAYTRQRDELRELLGDRREVLIG
jgi:hypothetical protein